MSNSNDHLKAIFRLGADEATKALGELYEVQTDMGLLAGDGVVVPFEQRVAVSLEIGLLNARLRELGR